MKIDLHCHTRKIKDGDMEEREITPELFNKKIIENEVKIVAITNHNCFDFEQFKKIKAISKGIYLLWPGIELDIMESENKGHVILICNPRNVVKFNNRIIKAIGKKDPQNFNMNLKDLHDNFKDVDIIYAFHYEKNPDLSLNNIKKFEEMIEDKYRVFYEPTNYRKLGILTSYGYRTILGSDVRDWNNYNDCTLPSLKLEIESFEQFLLLSRKDYAVVDTMLNKKNKTEIECVMPSKEKEIIPIYDDVNIIFGAKGTGKSVILKQINNEYSKMGKNIAYYEADSTNEKFNSKFKILETDRIINKLEIENCNQEIEEIKNWKDVNVTAIKDYIDYIETENTNENKKNLKIVEITDNTIGNNELKEITEFHKKVIEFKETIRTIGNKFLKGDTISEINESLDKVVSELKIKKKELIIKEYSNKLYIFTINKIKNLVDMRTGTKSKPISCNFTEYSTNKLRLYRNITKIDNNMHKEEKCDKKWLGKLEEKKDVYIETKYRMLTKESMTDEFKNNISDLKTAYNTFDSIKNNIFNNTLYDKIEELKGQEVINSIMQFVGISKYCVIKNSKGHYEKYKPSKGEETMLILQEKLNENKDIYILDEPEKSLGNSYVNNVIVPIINNLANMKKTIVIATHNANIAVRTLPYTSVYKKYNGEYLTYIGNPFTDKLINIKNKKDIESWKETSLNCLEGGEIAFDERGEIYGRI